MFKRFLSETEIKWISVSILKEKKTDKIHKNENANIVIWPKRSSTAYATDLRSFLFCRSSSSYLCAKENEMQTSIHISF